MPMFTRAVSILSHWVRICRYSSVEQSSCFSSSPDFASLVRYGDLLQQAHTCGRLLIYYFNLEGQVIQSEQDFAIQIPLDILRRCPNIIGVCSANTSVRALKGALNTGLLTHLVAREELVRSLFD